MPSYIRGIVYTKSYLVGFEVSFKSGGNIGRNALSFAFQFNHDLEVYKRIK